MRHARQAGLATLEVIVVGLILIVPLLWLLTVASDLHRTALAVAAAVRDAGVDGARAADRPEADRAIAAAVAVAMRDHGIDPADTRTRWIANPGLIRGATVQIEVRHPVTVLQAPFLGRVSGPSIWVGASKVARVDPFASRP